MKPWYKSGTTGWLLLAGLVAGWDFLVAGRMGGETLTAAFQRGLRVVPLLPDELPKGKEATDLIAPALVSAAWILTTLHLYKRLHPKLDPYHGLSVLFTRK